MGLSAVLLAVTMAATQPLAAAVPPSPPSASEHRGIALASAAVTLGLSNLAAAGVVWAATAARFEQLSRPDPFYIGLSLATGVAVQLLAAHFVVPEATRLGGVRDVERVRAEAWRWSRWAALLGSVSVGLFTTGALVERDQFGNGQALLLAGAVGSFVSFVLFDVLEVVGLSRGLRQP